MRPGYILLHRQGLTQEEWRHPLRTLAWFDFLTLAAWEDYTADDGVEFRRGEVVASYGFLATRWRKSKGEVHRIIDLWIRERQIERSRERCKERNAERFFVVNYAKYQDSGERVEERTRERSRERTREQMKVIQGKENIEIKTEKPSPTVKGPRPSVERVMGAMREAFGDLDGSEQANRRYCWLLIQRALKSSPAAGEAQAAEGCAALIMAAAKHPWWGSRIRKVETLYRNAQAIAAALREDKKPKVRFIS